MHPASGNRYRWAAAAALTMAAFNLFFRLGHEFVSEWDESLYAQSAWEAARHGTWLATTTLGRVDYYNTKPPLLVWSVAVMFKLFGANLWSLRIVPATSAWVTIATLHRWVRTTAGDVAALLTTLVLSTTFGFLHIHSGRSATTDASFALVIVLTVVTLWHSRRVPSRFLWTGPLMAAAFMLRGMGVLMPLAIVLMTIVFRRRRLMIPRGFVAGALALFLLPVATWVVARYQFDGWRFLYPLFMYDFVARTSTALEGHPGGLLYYGNILQKHHYDWLVAACAVWMLVRPRTPFVRNDGTDARAELAAWAIAAIAIPTMMQTKVPWYLNTFYPLFAVLVGVHLARAIADGSTTWRHYGVISVVCLAFAVAESKLVWYSFHQRDLRRSDQGALLAERGRLAGHRLYQVREDRARRFVATAIIGAEVRTLGDRIDFISASRPGDFLVTTNGCDGSNVRTLRHGSGFDLCERIGGISASRLR